MKKKPITICAFSDTHNRHRELKIPKCDILIFGGDAGITTYDKFEDFNEWIGKQPAKHKIVIMGNHDRYCEQIGKNDTKLLLNNAIYLENESVQIEGIKFWGSPCSLEFHGWSFMGNEERLAQIYQHIPENTDIVISHGPAFGILDVVGWKNQGSQALRYRIDEISPKYLISGHIHEDRGFLQKEFTTYINASILDERYQFVHEPILFDYESKLF